MYLCYPKERFRKTDMVKCNVVFSCLCVSLKQQRFIHKKEQCCSRPPGCAGTDQPESSLSLQRLWADTPQAFTPSSFYYHFTFRQSQECDSCAENAVPILGGSGPVQFSNQTSKILLNNALPYVTFPILLTIIDQ